MQSITGRFIVEMLGKPKEYIESTLKKYVDKFRENLDITSAEFAKPKEQEGGLFSVFAELEITFKNMSDLFGFCLDAMPSSVEIMDPETLTFESVYLADFLNDIQTKLHNTDMVVKTLSAQNKTLDKNAQTIVRNFIINLLAAGPKTIEELSKPIGIKPPKLQNFLTKLIEEKMVIQDGDTFRSH
ncbi:hypothetical protein GF342_05125 [Candidatus Woesearchaeota archaeon]|nr:hypothetical protein [Candidatus Woesearchaeota archaeon]